MDELSIYKKIYQSCYPEEFVDLFDMAVKLNTDTLRRQLCRKQESFIKLFNHIEQLRERDVYVYGCGKFGKQIYQILLWCGVSVKGFVVSDGEKKDKDEKVFWLTEIEMEDALLYIGVGAGIRKEIIEELRRRGLRNYLMPDDALFEYMES